jgi:hypothetical protein
MSRVPALLASLGALAAVVFVPAGAAAPAAPRPTISIGTIEATFDPANRLTRYRVSRFHLNGKAEPVTVTWTLTLELVDKAGAPDPATPGSGAAVDLGCTNAGVGTHEPQKAVVEPGHPTSAFVWHHPDPASSVPPGRYHCDHNDQGPRGHQGLVKVVVADQQWECTATYKGTETSTAKSVEEKTASEPKCSKVG